jgi:hypothetical protein
MVQGSTVIFRELTPDELQQQGRGNATKGYIIFDILPPDSFRVGLSSHETH